MLRDSYRCNSRTSTWYFVPFESGRLLAARAARKTVCLHAGVQLASKQNQSLSRLNNASIMIIGHAHNRNEWYVMIRPATGRSDTHRYV